MEAMIGVVAARVQRRDDAVPVLRDEFAFDLHFVAKRLGNIDVEAGQLSVGADCVEGRVGAFRADPDLGPLLVLRLRGACQRQHGGGGKRDAGKLTHCISLFFLLRVRQALWPSDDMRHCAVHFAPPQSPFRGSSAEPSPSGQPRPENGMNVTGRRVYLQHISGSR
jgi:hypothetical protein